jgi:hypothetical protein
MTVTIDEPAIRAILEAVIALALAIYAWWQRSQAVTAKQELVTTVSAFTPGTPDAKDPTIIATLPERSWKMDSATLDWCLFDATPDNKALIMQQINTAEAQHLTHYQVRFQGGFYEIEYGLLKGGAGNPSGKKTN